MSNWQRTENSSHRTGKMRAVRRLFCGSVCSLGNVLSQKSLIFIWSQLCQFGAQLPSDLGSVLRWRGIKEETMRRYSLAWLASGAVVLAARQLASAADLARRPPPAPAYVPPAPPAYLWTGCYVGGNIGGAWANFEVTN